MNGRRRREWGLPEAAFWGGLEVSSFLFLFLSPLLSFSAMVVVWHGLVLWRVGAVACRMHFMEGAVGREKLKELGRGLLYGVPFWTSALLFPLSVGQVEILTRAFALYAGLIFLTVGFARLGARWFPLSATALTGSVLGWLDGSWHFCLLGLALAGLALIGDRKPFSSALKFSPEALRLGALTVSGAWAFLLAWTALAAREEHRLLPRALLLWLFVVAASVLSFPAVRRRAEERRWQREVELSVPALFEGLRWRQAREIWWTWIPWSGYAMVVSGHEIWWLGALVLSGLGLQNLLGKEYVTSLHWQWWCCGQFVFYWGIAGSVGSTKFGWLAVGGLLSLAIAKSTPAELHEEGASVGRLEKELRAGLLFEAPDYLKRDILAQAEPSVDIDSSLQSSAPKGFRERLLQRLREADEE